MEFIRELCSSVWGGQSCPMPLGFPKSRNVAKPVGRPPVRAPGPAVHSKNPVITKAGLGASRGPGVRPTTKAMCPVEGKLSGIG